MTPEQLQTLKQAIEVEIKGSFLPGLELALEQFMIVAESDLRFGIAMSKLYNQDVGVTYNTELFHKLSEALISNLQLRVDIIGKKQNNGNNEHNETHSLRSDSAKEESATTNTLPVLSKSNLAA